mgnify:CR=1 FL=1
MIKFLLFLIIGIVIIVFRLFSAAIGTVSLAINKKGTFENFAHQFLKHTTKSKWVLKPYLPQLIDKILKYSDDRNYKIPDILDVLEATLRACVVKISPDDLYNFLDKASDSENPSEYNITCAILENSGFIIVIGLKFAFKLSGISVLPE